MIIKSCKSIKVSIVVITCFSDQINQIVLVKTCIIILLQSNMTILILEINLSTDKDLLFESSCCQINVVIYAHIVDHMLFEIHV